MMANSGDVAASHARKHNLLEKKTTRDGGLSFVCPAAKLEHLVFPQPCRGRMLASVGWMQAPRPGHWEAFPSPDKGPRAPSLLLTASPGRRVSFGALTAE